MSKRASITRYLLIVKKLQKHPATFEEILDYLEFESELQGYDFSISKRTFKRDLEDIEVHFGILIAYDFSEKVYKIMEDAFSETTERIFEAYDTFNALKLSDRISKYIHFDKRTPKGAEHLYHILKAIEKRKTISFDYQKYWDKGETFNRLVAPYALKEFKNRWYLLARDEHDQQLKTFALERIENLHIKRQKYSYPKDFDVQQYFENCFGIIRPENEKVEKTVLSFEPDEADYIKSLPLHHSQKIISDTPSEFCISLKINITFDFIKELLSYGERVQVIQPKPLAKHIKQQAKTVLDFYK